MAADRFAHPAKFRLEARLKGQGLECAGSSSLAVERIDGLPRTGSGYLPSHGWSMRVSGQLASRMGVRVHPNVQPFGQRPMHDGFRKTVSEPLRGARRH